MQHSKRKMLVNCLAKHWQTLARHARLDEGITSFSLSLSTSAWSIAPFVILR